MLDLKPFRHYLLYFLLFSLSIFAIAAYLDQKEVQLYKQQQIDVLHSATQTLSEKQLQQLIQTANNDQQNP